MTAIDEILDFWFGDGGSARAIAATRKELWWGGGEDSDRTIERRFAALVERGLRGELTEWASPPRGRLALVLLLDQFPRAVFRGRAKAFAGDAQALALALAALDAGVDAALRPIERVFIYLPFEHAEELTHQRRSVALFERLRDQAPATERELFAEYLDYARRHLEIVERFGRFPHRNQVLGRASTADEEAFLQQPGSSF